LPKRAVRARTVVLATLSVVACSAAATRRPARTTTTAGGDVAAVARTRGPRDASVRVVRIALARAVPQARISADGDWAFYTSDGAMLPDAPSLV
jgi:hypothetical protein